MDFANGWSSLFNNYQVLLIFVEFIWFVQSRQKCG